LLECGLPALAKGQPDKAENFLKHLAPLQATLAAYCRRWLKDRNEVADVLQSALASAFRDFHLYAEGTNFRAWIFRYVHLEIQNWNRKHARTRHAELPADLSVEDVWQLALDEPLVKVLLDDPAPILDRCDADLSRALESLSSLERSVLLLHAVGEFKYREIAETLQIPIGTVMSSLSRCRLRLRQRLVEYGVERGFLAPQEK
jgi:RNA polymerase sigma-70 factor (ECF subfamily)